MSQTLQYPCPEWPQPGERLEVAAGVYWLRFPLPFALDHVNAWLLADGDGWTLVDTGLDGCRTQDVWRTVFSRALGGRPLNRIIVTHYHPDHIGQAAWLSVQWQAHVLMTAGEWEIASRLHALSDQEAGDAYRRFFARHGLAAEPLERLAACGNTYRRRVSNLPLQPGIIAADDTINIDGDVWRVHVGRGHAPEHACLYRERDHVLISGDQVLPRISSNLAVRPGAPDEDPVTQFTHSLRGLKAALPVDTLVLPAHGRPFFGLHERIDELCAHHDAQLNVARDACRAQPRTAYDILSILFRRKLDTAQMMFAMSESIAHLNCLVAKGRAARVDHGGHFYFSAA